MRIPEAAVAALGDQRALARLPKVRQQGLLVLREDLRPRGDLDDAVSAMRPRAVLASAVAALLRLEVLLVAVVDQRIEVGNAFRPDVAALAAITAVRAAEFYELLAPETDAAIAPGSRRNVY